MGYVDNFKNGITRGPFYTLIKEGKSDDRTAVILYNGKKLDMFQCAVYQAWLDMCRTIKNKNKSSEKNWKNAKEILAESLREYFSGKPKNKEEAFDGWYYSLNSDVRKEGRLTIGQTQKLMNMAFKYLYCCGELQNKCRKHFAYCHMPLDGYILHWYKTNVDQSYDGKLWRNIDELKKYTDIVDRIRTHFKKKLLIEKEFSIWESEKKKAEEKELKSCAKKLQNSSWCNGELQALLDEFCEKIQE